MDKNFFQTLQYDLRHYGQGRPQLIVDKISFFHNLALAKSHIGGDISPRLVVKSLANIELLHQAMLYLDTDRLMIFHLPQLINVLENFPHADILFGKPMPSQAVKQFFESYPQYYHANIQWLVDQPCRLAQYLDLAKQYGLCLKINIEIDVGLHRGGVQSKDDFLGLLHQILHHPQHLKLTGLMGYDAHVAKLPKILKKITDAYRESQNQYQYYQQLILKYYPELWDEQLCFNGGGSPTFMLHAQRTVCNDVAFGSMLLKPSDFDLEILKDFRPALWLASPVLKVIEQVQLPALEVMSKLPIGQRAVFIYGGYWLAKVVYPQGLKPHLLYGRSSNQEMLVMSKQTQLSIDDYIILRPTQSEAILPQFDQLSVYTQDQFVIANNLRE